MTTAIEEPAVGDVDATIDGVCALVAARSAEIEAAGRLPADLVDVLRRAGWFRLLLPAEHGGGAADLPTAVDRFARLAAADASTGWTVMIGAGLWCDLVGLDRAVFDEVFARERDALLAGVFNPTGRTSSAAGGYRVDARWAFASGCEHATWVYGNCVEAGEPAGRIRTVLLPADDVVIEQTWDPPGLRGTGSHHLRVEGVVVDAARTFATFEAEPCLDVPIVRVPVPTLLALAISAVSVGIAVGALEDLRALAHGKVPLLDSRPISANPTFHQQLGTATATLDAARAVLDDAAGTAWAKAVDGDPLDLPVRAHLRAAACWAVERAAGIVTIAYRAAGSAVLDVNHPLARRFRDVHALTQHFLVRPDTIGVAGAILAGQDVEVPVF